MNTPRQIAANRLSPQRPAGPRSAAGKAASPCQFPQNRPPCPNLGSPEPPPEAKANFVQPQSAQQKIGFVPSFCPAPDAISPEPVPPALEGPELQVLESIEGCSSETSETSNPPPAPFPQRPEFPETGSRSLPVRGCLGVKKFFSPPRAFPETVTRPRPAPIPNPRSH